LKREKTTEGFPVVFSLGDPHGIGPEVILKALQLSRSLPDINPIAGVDLFKGEGDIKGPTGFGVKTLVEIVDRPPQ